MFDVKLLNKIKFFSDFSQEEKLQIARQDNAVFRKFEKNEPIINEGDVGDAFFVVLKGEVDVYKKPNVNPIATLRPGAVFGEISFLSPRIRTASISSSETCIVLEINKKILKNLTYEVSDKLKDKLISLLIQHLDEIIELRTKDHFSTAKTNPFEEGIKMKNIKQKVNIFSDGGYHIYYLGNLEALLENEVEGTSKRVTMVELSNKLPQKQLNFIKESRQDPGDYLFAQSSEYGGYLVPKAAQHAWKSVMTTFQAENMSRSRAVQMYQKLDEIY